MLSRELQKLILTQYASVYPDLVSENFEYEGFSKDAAKSNIFYLSEHGLIEGSWTYELDGKPFSGALRIPAKGMDFLQDDGGLSAILGTITIKLHDDKIRALLIDRIEKSDADPVSKGGMIAAIKALPAEALKKLAHKAMDAGIEHLPRKFEQLQALLSLL